jgi:predicted AAA+ superfamily ATPase
MERFHRRLDISAEAREKSVFLFGPRQTGKTHLLRDLFPASPRYDLLRAAEFLRLTQAPHIIREELSARRDSLAGVPIVIDEIQKLPILLDEVHAMIEDFGLTFVLTGSSSRKLKRGGANLLGGRARTRHLFPLVYPEIPHYDVVRACNFGTIPSMYTSSEPIEDLKSYCGNYLKEEIQQEGQVRRIENFSRFLEVAGLVNGELLNLETLANDVGVSAPTLREYLSILEDTLIGSLLRPYKKTVHRKGVSSAKFYFFDVGVSNVLAKRGLVEKKSELFGKAFEQLIHNELRAYLSYSHDDRPLSFWQDRNRHEVDFLIGDDVGIEVKASSQVSGKHLKGLRMLSEEVALKHKVVVSLDPAPRMVDGIEVLPHAEFMARLWGGGFA